MADHDPDARAGPQAAGDLVADARARSEGALVEDDADELPIVARMVVEIRSDGSRTIARGAIEDRLQDQQVAVEAEAGSPLELSRALAKLLLSAPLAALIRGTQGTRADGAGPPGERREGPVKALGRALGRRLERSLGAASSPVGPRVGPRVGRGEDPEQD